MRQSSVRIKRRTRTVLWILGIAQLATGIWAFAFPASWFRSYPGLDLDWVSELGPYNQHLAVDVGAFFIAFGALLLIAGYLLDRRLVGVASVVELAFALPHFVYHVVQLNRLPAASGVLQMLVLGTQVLLPFVVLRSVRRL